MLTLYFIIAAVVFALLATGAAGFADAEANWLGFDAVSAYLFTVMFFASIYFGFTV